MKLNDLAPKDGSMKDRTRVGRGIGSGKGKTCGSGHKGQKARTGVAIKGFEGGQMPIYRRLPKRGFSNARSAKQYTVLSVGQLQAAIDSKKIDAKKDITEDVLVQARVVRRKKDGIRLIGGGELKAKVALKITGVTAGAKETVEKAGGTIEVAAPKADEKAA